MNKVSIVISGKVCPRCNTYKDLDEFPLKYKNKDGRNSWCRECNRIQSKEYYYRNHDKMLVYFRNRYNNNKEQVNEINKRSKTKRRDKINLYFRERGKEKREEFLDLYGGKCECCGESERTFLTIDHVNGQRGKKREGGTHVYYKAIRSFPSKEYRILCMNCNHATRWGKICPHQVKNEQS